jgi:hypothetical protein
LCSRRCFWQYAVRPSFEFCGMPMALTFSVTKQKREDETNWRDSTIEREWKVNIHEFSSGKSISKIFGDGGVDGDGKRRS